MNQSGAKYFMIGGFLGAGKTTCVGRFAQWLTDRKLRVGLITNDQGNQLVDTAYLRAKGFPTQEISGGCFCCRFDSLTEAAASLTNESRPEAFVAEPVGSCTDLVATVSYPLRRIYGDQYTIAPLSVVVDPRRARRVMGLEEGRGFSEKVNYIYRKQLEEADIIVINKTDLLREEEVEALTEALGKAFPHATLLNVSARTGDGLEGWFERMLGAEGGRREAMAVDYEVYAEGEALLGWLNATLRLSSEDGFDANEVLKTLTDRIQRNLAQAESETAHLKMTFEPSRGLGELAVINVVGGEFVSELSQRVDERYGDGTLIVNLRAEGEPEVLKAALLEAVSELSGLNASVEHLEHFKPGKPEPTHRETTSV